MSQLRQSEAGDRKAVEPAASWVRLSPSQGPGVEGLVCELRELVVQVVFPLDEAPCLAVGSSAKVELCRIGLEHAPSAMARVLSRSEGTQDERSYRLELPPLGSVGGALSAHLLASVNQRDSYRVRPEPLSSVGVNVRPIGGREAVRASLTDISAGGIGLRVAPAGERRLREVEQVQLSFRLPGSLEVQLPATIRSRQLCGRVIRYGVQFDAVNEDVDEARRQVVGYVARRQAEDLRQALQPRREN